MTPNQKLSSEVRAALDSSGPVTLEFPYIRELTEPELVFLCEQLDAMGETALNRSWAGWPNVNDLIGRVLVLIEQERARRFGYVPPERNSVSLGLADPNPCN
jgi:hypothetical protein